MVVIIEAHVQTRGRSSEVEPGALGVLCQEHARLGRCQGSSGGCGER